MYAPLYAAGYVSNDELVVEWTSLLKSMTGIPADISGNIIRNLYEKGPKDAVTHVLSLGRKLRSLIRTDVLQVARKAVVNDEQKVDARLKNFKISPLVGVSDTELAENKLQNARIQQWSLNRA